MRQQLRKAIERYISRGGRSDAARRCLALLDAPGCFRRDHFQPGHFTASAWVVDPAEHSCVLVHHRKLDRWLQPGGHADGEADLPAVAAQELVEETGIEAVAEPGIFDIDIHLIPPWGAAPAHAHFDLRYRFVVPRDTALVLNAAESKAVAWVPLSELSAYEVDASVQRLAQGASVAASSAASSAAPLPDSRAG